MATETKTPVKYPGVPKDVTTKSPQDIIFSGKSGSPFVAEIVDIERQAEEIRMSMSRYLATWQRVYEQARQAGDVPVMQRAHNELNGLHRLLGRLSVATT